MAGTEALFPLACWAWLKVDMRLLLKGWFACPGTFSRVGGSWIQRRDPGAGLLLCGQWPRGSGCVKHFDAISSLSSSRHSLAG